MDDLAEGLLSRLFHLRRGYANIRVVNQYREYGLSGEDQGSSNFF
jgi:hypothetical protein